MAEKTARDGAGAAVAAGSLTSAGVAVHEHGAGSPLAGPGTGRAVSQPSDARRERMASFDPAAFEVPTGREEDWRFTPLRRVRGLHKDGVAADAAVSVDVRVGAADSAVLVETVDRTDPRLGRAGVPVDRVAATAFANFGKATVVSVPRGVELAEPVMVTVSGSGGTAFGHVLVEIGELSSAVVVLDHQGSATYADNVEFVVGDGARLTVVVLHDWAADAVHLSQQHVLVGRDATVKTVNVSLGGDLVRVVTRLRYAAAGGDADLLGLFYADAGQHLEHRLFVDHEAPHCKSRVTYRGALQGRDAHTVWVGDVLIRASAEGTDTYELNRNLVLTDGARADSVPNLEIETGEVVGAGHASTTGRFDDEQLFYLQSRGIPEREARRLVVRGFFVDLINRIGVPEVERRLLAEIDAELEASVG
jgi:Fe-S cluster assembly protein SufD